jgi:hypothetical protein
MKKNIFLISAIGLMFLLSPLAGLAQKDKALAWWEFDRVAEGRVIDSASGIEDVVDGNYKLVPGVSGRGLKFDGFTTVIKRRAEAAPKPAGDFTLEA